MTEQTQRLRRALHGCAEQGISPTTEPWTEIQTRLDARESPRTRRLRFMPRTRSGMVLAAVLILVFGMGAYTGFPLIYNVFQEALPGSSPGRNVGTEIGQVRIDGGAKVVLEYAYADTKFVVVGYTVQDLREDRNIDGHPSELSPIQIDDTDRTPEQEKADLPPRVNLTDASGQDFDTAEGGVTYHVDDPDDVMWAKPNVAIFTPSKGLEPGARHRFHLDVALEESGIFRPGETSAPYDETPGVGPFAFDFEVPVRPIPVVEVGQKETVKGVTLNLVRVLNSPGKPQAIVCFQPPDDEYHWRPSTAPTGFQFEEPLPADALGNGCWSLTIEDPVAGRSTVKVTEIWGAPRTERAMREDEDGKEIEGPWIFEFEAPVPPPSASPLFQDAQPPDKAGG